MSGRRGGRARSLLTMVHDGWSTAGGIYQSVAEGWSLVLSGLETLLETGEPLPAERGEDPPRPRPHLCAETGRGPTGENRRDANRKSAIVYGMPAARRAPTLTDGAIELRPPLEGDAEAILAACQDPDIGRFTAIPVPYEAHHAAEWISASPGQWQSGTTRPLVVLDRATGELLGSCGLIDVSEERAEIGYWVKREARGRGVAPRAVRLVSEWALGEAGLRRVELLADVRNLGSQRVAEKAGYIRQGEVPPPARCAGRCERMVLFARERPSR